MIYDDMRYCKYDINIEYILELYPLGRVYNSKLCRIGVLLV